MDYDQLKTFLTVNEALNYSRAAEQLNVTQPTVTARIQNIETELDCKLFHKIGRTIMLSKEGENLIKYAEKIVRYMDEAKDSMLLMKKPHLKIGIAPGFSPKIILDLLYIFESNYHLMITIIEGKDSIEVSNMVQNKEIDLAIVRDYNSVPELTVRHIFDDRLVFLVGQEHHLAKKVDISKQDLHGEMMICYIRNTKLWIKIEERLTEVKNLRKIEIGNLELLKSMVKNNSGFSILPLSAIEKEEYDCFYIVQGEELNEIHRKVSALFYPDSPNLQNIELFIDAFINRMTKQ